MKVRAVRIVACAVLPEGPSSLAITTAGTGCGGLVRQSLLGWNPGELGGLLWLPRRKQHISRPRRESQRRSGRANTGCGSIR